MERREFLMLAQVFDRDKHRIGNWFVSKKLDGQRAFWDGGVSRGQPKHLVPWANNDKDQRYKEPPIATGLWSRYGNVIHAPEWFLNNLPKGILLDGELYIDRGLFQETRTIISTLVPGAGWSRVKYHVFDLPSVNNFCQQGRVNVPNFIKNIIEATCLSYFDRTLERIYRFDEQIPRLRNLVRNETVTVLNQIRLHHDEDKAYEQAMALLDAEISVGGEGIMLRAPQSWWCPKRSPHLLKVKPFTDDEGIIIGFVTGIGKLRGLIGAVIVEWNGKQFQLSGFTDEERCFDTGAGHQYAADNPGTILLAPHQGRFFKRGDVIRFKFRELTKDGIPREARYFR